MSSTHYILNTNTYILLVHAYIHKDSIIGPLSIIIMGTLLKFTAAKTTIRAMMRATKDP